MAKKFTYSDFDSKLNITSGGNVTVVYDEDAIIQSIRHIMATVQGERVRSDFGGSLIRVLFEPMTEYVVDDIRRFLKQALDKYEPRVELLNIDVTPDFTQGSYDIRLEMMVREINQVIDFSTKLRAFA